jgi:hypothetical protein
MNQNIPSGEVPMVPRRTPFKFLDYFEDKQSDSLRFAGREQDIAEVVSRALADRTFVLFGRSGLGKTSLLLAGVFPEFRERGFFPLHVRLLDDPLSDLQKTLKAAVVGDGPVPSDLEGLVARLPGDAGVLLAFDQFEEFFIRNRAEPEIRRHFIRKLVELLEHSRRHLRVMFSLREDFLAEMDDFSADYPEILGNLYRLRPLTAFGSRQAIIAPLVADKIKFSEQLIRKLVDFLAKEHFDPLVLQIVCNEVYREATKKDRFDELREEDLDRIGGIDKLFDRYLQYAISNVDPGVIVLTRAILDALISSEGTKRTVTIDDLFGNEDFMASKDEIQKVLDLLKKRKLVREESRNGRLWYELSHDRLAPSIIKWFNDDEQFAEFRDARNFASAGLRDEFRTRLEHLLSPSQFTHVQKYRNRLRLVRVQQEFMFWSAVTICAKPEDLQYWSDLLPDETVLTTLQTLIKDEEQQVRLGAVTALPALHDVGRKLAAACVTVALEDRVPSVRRAAGQSLAALDCHDETAVINERLRHKGRRQAVEILGDFYDAGKQLDGLPFWWRWLGRRESRSRAMEKHRLAIDARARRGAAVGVVAGLLWSAVIGVPLVATVVWSKLDLLWRNSLPMYGAYLALAAIIGGLYLGSTVAKTAAKQAAISHDGRWLLASWKDWLAPLVMFGVALYLDRRGIGMPLVVALVFTTVAGAYVALLRPAVWPATPRSLIVLMGLAAGLVPMVATVLLVTAAPEWLAGFVKWKSLLVASMAFLSFLSCTRVMALAETTRSQPIGPQPRFPSGIRMLTRVAVGVAALALIPLHISAFGTPWRPLVSAAVEADRPIPLPSGGSGYFKVNNPKDHPQWYEVTGLPDDAELAVRGDREDRRHSHEKEQTLLLLDMGTTVGSIKPSDEPPDEEATPSSEPKSTAIRLTAIPDLDRDAILTLSTTERRPYLLRLTRSPHDSDRPTWAGTWNLRLKDAPEGSSLVMVFPETASDHKGEVVDLSGRKADFGIPSGSFSASYPKATDKSYNGLNYTLAQDQLQITLTATFQSGGPAEKDANGRDVYSKAKVVHVKDIYVAVLLSLSTEAASLFEAGYSLVRVQRYSEALPKLEAAAKLSPDNPLYLNNFAWALVAIAITTNATLDPRALEAAKAAVQGEPKRSQFLDTLAHAEYLSGNMIGARDAWSTLYKNDPGYSDQDPLCARDKELLETLKKQAGIAKRP